MGSQNQSPSYLREREGVRRWLSGTKQGRFATEVIKRRDPKESSRVLDDDRFTNWEDLHREYKDGLIIAASCKEARSAWALRRAVKGQWASILSLDFGYVERRKYETNDEHYWNDPKNVYIECLRNPEFCRAPRSYIVGQLMKYQPKGRRVTLADSRGNIVESDKTQPGKQSAA